jgi:trehalose utilization protein
MHWFDFGGFTFEPQTLELRNEDPSNPIVAHVGSTWKISDETYAWQVNPRADVHVLLSMVNTSVPEGALYDDAQPLAWCRPFGAGRTFYTNQGHIDALYKNKDYETELLQGIRYAAGRLATDCGSVPEVAGRLEAVWADQTRSAPAALSNESGGLAVVTGISPQTRLTWRKVDIGRVRRIELHVAGLHQTDPPQTTILARWAASGGGTVGIHLDRPNGPLVATSTIGPAAAWATQSVSVPRSFHGVHSLVFTFTPTVPGQPVGSLAWVRLIPRPGK